MITKEEINLFREPALRWFISVTNVMKNQVKNNEGISYLNYKKYLIKEGNEGHYEYCGDPLTSRVLNRMKIREIEENINSGKYDEKNVEYYEQEMNYINMCNEVLRYIDYAAHKNEDSYRLLKAKYNEQDRENRIRMKNGLPSYFDVYKYIFFKVQFFSDMELAERVQWFDINNQKYDSIKRLIKGNSLYKYVIKVYDKDGKELYEFENFSDCKEKFGLSKSMLSQLLSPNNIKKKTWHDMTFKKYKKANMDV